MEENGPMTSSILILGGTAEARSLADALTDCGTRVLSSLAGRVQNPVLPAGEVRVGGFGGVDGLVRWLVKNRPAAVVDATHPFAANISANAVAACARTRVPLLRLERPGWSEHTLADTWRWVDSMESVCQAMESLGTRPLITTGRQGLDHYGHWRERWALVRVVEPPENPPAAWEILCRRGPFDLDTERRLMREHDIDVLTTKDSGGSLTEPKLRAAHDLGVQVIIVRRPTPPEVDVVNTVDAATRWVLERA